MRPSLSLINIDYRQPMALLTAREAAARLGVKPESLYAYVSRGLLTSRRRAGKRGSVYDSAEIEALARRGRPRAASRSTGIDFAIESRITSIANGRLSFRGRDATRLARSATFERVAELLWTGELPERGPRWRSLGIEAPVMPTLVDQLRMAVVLAGAADPRRGDLAPASIVAAGRGLLATMVEALPLAGDAPSRGSLAPQLWARLSTARPRSAMVDVLNAALVLVADHELAASTLAVRVAASTRADPYAVVSAGMGPLAGPLHGAASREVHRLLKAAGASGPEAALAETLKVHQLYPGFGHPLYPDGDPRAKTLLTLLRAASPDLAKMATVDATVRTIQRRSRIYPTIDFALGALTYVAGMPAEAGEAIFTISRAAGWLAHALEEYGEAPLRYRIRAVYVG
jgi:citrate synthase